MCIYKITNIVNNKSYIGLTTKLPIRRKKEHFSLLSKNKHGNSHLQSSWNKHGEDNFKFEVIDTGVDLEDLNNLEIHWINHYKTIESVNGYNKTSGGKCTTFTDEAKKNMSLAQKEFYSTPEGIERLKELANYRIGKAPHNKGVKTNKPSWNAGIPQTAEQKAHHSRVMKGKPSGTRKGRKTGKNATNAKSIICNETGKVYPSSHQAAFDLQVNPRSIRRVVSGERKSIKGFTFKLHIEEKLLMKTTLLITLLVLSSCTSYRLVDIDDCTAVVGSIKKCREVE